MVFSSLTFLYLFLPLALVSYVLCKNRAYRNGVLLALSLVFYAWGEPRYVLVMLAACVVTYLSGILMARFDRRPGAKRAVFLTSIVLLLGNLFLFKYLGFFTGNLRLLFPGLPELSLPLPIGISFYTFQTLSYVIDLYWGKVRAQRNPFYLALYVSFFPQLIAGPIVRYQTIEEEIENRHENLEDAAAGLRRFLVGLAKKVVLANNLSFLAELIYGGDASLYGTALYWVAAISYTLQIYFDFSGYSDMAIGLGRMFGFHFLENFNYPYLACSITDFWRRWHISLSTWFRDYVYIPLGGNRAGRGRWALNLLIVWGLTGLWHGASWNFLLWGLYYGVLLLLEKLLLGRFLEKLPRAVRWLYTMFFVVIGWVLFNLTDFSALGQALEMMLVYHPTQWAEMFAADTQVILGVVYLPLGILCSFPVLRRLKRREGPGMTALENFLCALLLLICAAMIISSSYNPFIYFRF